MPLDHADCTAPTLKQHERIIHIIQIIPIIQIRNPCMPWKVSAFKRESIICPRCERLHPFRTAAPLWGQTTQILSNMSPKRDCGSKRVKGANLIFRTYRYTATKKIVQWAQGDRTQQSRSGRKNKTKNEKLEETKNKLN